MTQKSVRSLLSKMLSSLRVTSGELGDSVQRREVLLRQSRDVLALASQAMVAVQSGRFGQARHMLDDGRRLLDELREKASSDLGRYLVAPGAELVEAEALWAAAQGRPIPARGSLGVDGGTYLLGLLDAVGEIRRLVVDRIRVGEVKEAETLFEVMEKIYMHLTPFAVYDHVVSGVRRKLDVNRLLVENTRALVAEEVRRSALLKAMEEVGVDLKRRG